MKRTLRSGAALVGAALALALTVPTVAAAADPFPLAAWYPLNEGSGQVVRDWSGHRNHGYLGSTTGADDNDPSWIRGVFLGSALNFGGDDFVTIPDSPWLEPANITVSAWMRGSASPGRFKYIAGKGAEGCRTGSWGLYSGNGGGAGFYVFDGVDFYRSPEAPISVWDGRWHNIAGTFDGSTVRFYLDGQEIGSGTSTDSKPIDYTTGTSGEAQLGGYPGGCDLYLVGDVDGVQVWSKALPVADVWKALRPLLTAGR